MKALYTPILIVLLTFFCNTAYSQSVKTNHNNLTVSTSSHGILFNDVSSGTAGLIHKTEEVAIIYSANLWLTALTQNGQITSSVGLYRTDFSPGTTDRDDQLDSSLTMVTITSSEIQNHRENYNSPGYTIPTEIQNWPTHFLNLNGNRTPAAPFIDLNNNNKYEPEKGEYPDILGNTFTFVVLNDTRGFRQGSSGDPVGVDVFLSVFSWDIPSDEAISNSIFVNYKIINTSSNSYNQLQKGMFIDFDLGNPSDDYIGTDSINNFIYAYNGDNDDDEAIGPSPGFGNNPPAVGAQILCNKLTSSISFSPNPGPTGAPSLPTDFYYYMNSRWKDNTPLINNGTGHNTQGENTSYIFHGNAEEGIGWTESNSQTNPGDRNMIMTATEQITFDPGDIQNFTVAFSYARDNTKNHIENITTLRNTFGSIGRFLDSEKLSFSNYWSDNFSCQLVGVEENISNSIAIHPNPTTNVLNIENADNFSTYKIASIDGKVLMEGNTTKTLDVRMLKTGIYHLQLLNKNGGYSSTKFLKN